MADPRSGKVQEQRIARLVGADLADQLSEGPRGDRGPSHANGGSGSRARRAARWRAIGGLSHDDDHDVSVAVAALGEQAAAWTSRQVTIRCISLSPVSDVQCILQGRRG
jgi:hypothetical protein